MKKPTLKDVKNESFDSAGLALGVVGGSVIMKVAGRSLSSLPPWVLPVFAIAAGYGIGLVSENSVVKNASKGVMAAGFIDGTAKTLNYFRAKVPAIASISDYVPALSGPEQTPVSFVAPSLRGEYTPAQVIATSSLRG